MAAFTAQMSALVALPFELQRLGHDAVSIGLLITPWPLALACAAQVAGRLADRYAAGLLGGVGLLLLATGLLLLALLPEQAGNVSLMWRLALCGIGFGLFQAPNNRALLSAAPRARSGAAGGLLGIGTIVGPDSRSGHRRAVVARRSAGRLASRAVGVQRHRLPRDARESAAPRYGGGSGRRSGRGPGAGSGLGRHQATIFEQRAELGRTAVEVTKLRLRILTAAA